MKIPVAPGQQVAPRQGSFQPLQAQSATGGYDELHQGITSAGRAIDAGVDAYLQEQHKARVAAINEKDTAFKNSVITELDGGPADTSAPTPDVTKMTEQQFGDFLGAPKRQPGFLSLRGTAPGEQRDQVLGRLEERRQELAGELKDPEARKLFLQSTTQDMLHTRARVEEHVTTQLRVAVVDSLKGLEDVSLRDVSANFMNDGLASDVEASVVGRIGVAHSESNEGRDAEIADWQSRITSTRLNQFIAAKDWAGAQNLYAREKDRLSAAQGPHFATAIGELGKRVLDDRTATTLMETTRDKNGFVDPATAINSFQALPEAQRDRDAQEAFGRAMMLEANKKKGAVDTVYNGALGAYLQNHSLKDVNPYAKAWLQDVDSESWHKLERMQHADAEAARGSPPTLQQQVALGKLMADVADNPEKYATMSPDAFAATWFHQLHRSDRDRASGLLASMHAQAGKTEKLSPVEQDMLLQRGREAGVFDKSKNDVSKWSDEEASNFYAAQTILAKKIQVEKKATGKDVPPEKLKEWVDELLRSGKQEGKGFFGFGAGTTRLEAEAEGQLLGFKPAWSDDEKAKAVEVLKKSGGRIDDEAIDRVLRKVKGLPALPQQAAPAKDPNEVDPGKWGLDLTPLEEAQMGTDRPMDKL